MSYDLDTSRGLQAAVSGVARAPAIPTPHVSAKLRPHIHELDGPPKVGEHYWVPSVTGNYYGIVDHWPVLGPKACDRPHIDIDPLHYHIDPRFIAAGTWRKLPRNTALGARMWTPWNGLAFYPLIAEPGYLPADWSPPLEGLPAPRNLLLQCLRPMDDRARAFADAEFMDGLRAAHADKRLGPNMTCPHKGACLKSQPVVDGVVTCPQHGLRWNVATGELVP